MQNHFTDTIFYQVELTAKYFKLLGQQIFEKYNTGITIEELSALDTIYCNPKICQRDIAKLILKDRANTGKLLDILEKKGFITRHLSIKNNRPVKIAEITPEGIAKLNDVHEKLRPNKEYIDEKIKNSNIAKLSDLLKELRDILSESIENKI